MSSEILHPTDTDTVYDQMQERGVSELALDLDIDSTETDDPRTRVETSSIVIVTGTELTSEQDHEEGRQNVSLDNTTNKEKDVCNTSSQSLYSEMVEIGDEDDKSLQEQIRRGEKRKHDDIVNDDSLEIDSSQMSKIAILQDVKDNRKIHTGEKPFTCGVCEFACTRSSVLKTHMMIHTGEKPYRCDVCEYSTRRSTHLKIHMRTHTGEKPYTCNVCNSAFTQTSTLTAHMRTHTGEKPYKCDVCEYSATSSSIFKKHMRKHKEEKFYKCEVCEYASTMSSNLKKHMMIHTGEKNLTNVMSVNMYQLSHLT